MQTSLGILGPSYDHKIEEFKLTRQSFVKEAEAKSKHVDPNGLKLKL